MAKKNDDKVDSLVKDQKPDILEIIKRIKMQTVTLRIVGETDYIPGQPPSYLADYMKAMMDRRVGEKRPVLPRMSPKEEAAACLYYSHDKKHPYAIPAAQVHASMMQAAKEIMHLPVDHQRLFRVNGGMLTLVCENFDLCSKDKVFRGKKKNGEWVTHYPVTVYRPHFHAPWYVDATIRFKPDVITLATIVELVHNAGQFVGLGQGRPGLGGHENFGTSLIEGTDIEKQVA